MIPAQTRPIPPEAIAYKQAAWKNCETPRFDRQAKALPRLPQVLWFLQAMSMQPGGLDQFAQTFLDTFPRRIGTPAMCALHKAPEDTPAQRSAILQEIPRYYYTRYCDPEVQLLREFWESILTLDGDIDENRAGKLASADFYDICLKTAQIHLARHLRDSCVRGADAEQQDQSYEKDTPLEDVWYFHDLPGALIEFLDVHAARVRQTLAMTAVALQVFDALDYAWQEKAMVLIEGNSRFGKTQSVRTWCTALPGQGRLVRTPCTNNDRDLLEAIAEAVGIEVTPHTTRRTLKTKVEYVICHGGLMFVFDEAHFLMPQRFCKLTPPMRLNWIRTRIADQGCPLALVTTPQDFQGNVGRFTRATGHNINQFLGRTLLTKHLPSELELPDLIAVAKIHFPDLDADYLEMIAGTAMMSESYLMAVEAIARRARFLCRRDGRAALTLADVETAIAEVIPGSSATARPAPVSPAPRKQPVAFKRSRAVTPQPPTAPLEIPAREVTPTQEIINA